MGEIWKDIGFVVAVVGAVCACAVLFPRMGDGGGGFLLAAFTLYLIPSWIAFGRGHHNAVAITLLNVFLGWTFLGWVAALIWSATAVRPALQPTPPTPLPAAGQTDPADHLA